LAAPEETLARNLGHGVAAVPKASIAARGLVLEVDPQDTEDDLRRNPSHRIVRNVSVNDCGPITKSAEIVFRLPGWQVVGAAGTVGVDATGVLVQLPPLPMAAEPTKPEDRLTLELPFEGPKK
jgi:hypothetical protein